MASPKWENWITVPSRTGRQVDFRLSANDLDNETATANKKGAPRKSRNDEYHVMLTASPSVVRLLRPGPSWLDGSSEVVCSPLLPLNYLEWRSLAMNKSHMAHLVVA